MKKLLTILLVLISFSSFAQFEAGEFVNTDTVKIDGVPLLLNTFKQGNLGGAGNIFYSTSASSQPASGSINQVIGGNTLTSGYVPYFNGTNLANTNVYFDGTNLGIGTTTYTGQLTQKSNGTTLPAYAIQDGNGANSFEIRVGLASRGVTSVGFNAGYLNTTGRYWTANGVNAGFSNTKGGYWTANGVNAGYSNTTGNGWTANGVNAGFSSTTGDYWTANGVNAGYSNTTGRYWTANGYNAGHSNTTGNYWTANGYAAGRYLTDGKTGARVFNNCVYEGAFTKVSAENVTNENVFGYNAIGSGSNTVRLGDVNVTDVYTEGKYNGTTAKLSTLSGTGTRLATVGADGTLGATSELTSNFLTKADTLTLLSTKKNNADSTKYLKENAIGNISISVSGERLALNQTKVIGSTSVSDLIQRVTTDHDGLMTKDQLKRLTDTVPKLSGTVNYIPKITGTNTLGNSSLIDYGSYMNSSVQFKAPIFYAGSTAYSAGNVDLGFGRTGDNFAYINFIGDQTYTDYGLRIIRGNTGENTSSNLLHRGKGDFSILAQDAGRVILGTKNTSALIIDTLQNVGIGTITPAARIHSQSTDTQLRLGYNATKYTDLSTNSAGTFNISPLGGFTTFSGGISASGYSTFSGQVEMIGFDVNLGASTVLRKNGSDVFISPITMGASGSAGQVLTSTGANSSPIWQTPTTGSGSGITSIGMSVPTELTVNPSSLTANGTFTIGLQSGYSIPTTANQTNWSTAYTNRITSASGTTPLALSISNNTLSGSLSWTLTNINNATPSVGYLYYNGSTYSYQAATTTYTLPTASSSTLGGVKINGNGMAINAGGVLFQEDNNLTTRTPETSDYIAFYDNSATAQGKMTLSTLGSLIGGSGGSMVYPGAGIPVSTGSAWGTSKTAPSGEIVGTTDSQALTNKSINRVTLSTSEGPTRFLRGDGTYQRLNIVQTLTSAPSIKMDIWNGSKAVLTLATNSTITITNVPNGGEGSIEVTSSGAYTLAIAGSTGYTSTQKMGTVSAIASSAHTTVFYWRSGSTLYYGFLLNN